MLRAQTLRRFLRHQMSLSKFPGEPSGPSMKTDSVPGPKSQEYIKSLSEVTDAQHGMVVQDLENSKGNYLADIDGNMMLDVFNNIASTAIGYNHPDLLKTAMSPEVASHMVNRSALGAQPVKTYKESIEKAFMDIKPPGMDTVFTQMCGTCANESAFKLAFMHYQLQKRGHTNFSAEELDTCMCNSLPGSPDLAIMSFSKAFHGRLLGALSATRSKAIHKLDIPAFDWPKAPSPVYKYPLGQNEEYNKTQDDLCLKEIDEILDSGRWEVAAAIIEPIQAEGGDNMISGYFARHLQSTLKKRGISLIIDEVQTGYMATGKMWAYEHWNLEFPPDFVTVSKKMMLGAIYTQKKFSPTLAYRHYNTWMGDMARMSMLGTQNMVLKRDDLQKNVLASGEVLKDGLDGLAQKYPSLLQSPRGFGTFLAFDVAEDAGKRNQLIQKMKENGVFIGACGDYTVRLRPSLYFLPEHAWIFLEKLEVVLKQMQDC